MPGSAEIEVEITDSGDSVYIVGDNVDQIELDNANDRLVEVGHDNHHATVVSLHVHLDHDRCLEVIVLRHVTLPVGVPQTISRLSRYTVIVVGVMVAFSAIGFDVSKAALVAGGLGVGIGFGLQNIVNNFVSGLILLFERPIRVGDTIELGTTSGVVEKIGMRATLIRTWTGPELVVPNAQLVSSEVLNWNLKRDRKRAEVPVGVAYDSDPEVVAGILTEVAVAHPDVLEHPEPECLFLGFGDSSLDFQLRAWAATEKSFQVQSDLRFAIRKALTDAGIEIPFPQRDLPIKTTTDESPKDA